MRQVAASILLCWTKGKRLSDMEKRLAERMDSLDVQAEPTHVDCRNPKLIDA
mgnify:CR=1 FL=1